MTLREATSSSSFRRTSGSTTAPFPMRSFFLRRTPEGRRWNASFVPPDDDRMAGVGAAVESRHSFVPFGEIVDDFPLPFVAPLKAHDDGGRQDSQTRTDGAF